MNNALLYLGSFLALVFGALFAVPHVVDWNDYRGVFEEEAARVLGRDVRVGGNVSVRLLPVPFVSFEKVRIANAGNLTGQPFFSVDSFTMKLAASPLLRGAIEAKEIELDRPVLALAIDNEGRGNWSSIEIARRELPFIPADVAFRSVKVTNAEVAVFGPRGNELFRTTGIDGEVTAEGLKGPYAFRGTADWAGRSGDLKLATTQVAADGSFRLKVAVKDDRTGATGGFDALVNNFSNGLTYQGDVTLRTPFGAGDTSLPAFATAPVSDTAAAVEPWADIKAAIAGDGRALAMSGLNVSVEQKGEPQIITGSAKVDWSAAPIVELNLGSRWLDLDKLIGTGASATPGQRLSELTGLLRTAVPPGTRAKIRVALDQAKIAGDDVGSFKFEAARQDAGPLLLNAVEAGLPGGARVTMSGELGGTTDIPELKAVVETSGADLGRLARWLQWPEVTAAVGDAFIIKADVAAAPGAVTLSNLSADVAGMTFSGRVKYSAAEPAPASTASAAATRAKLDVTVDAQTLDTAKVFPGLAAAIESRLRRPFESGDTATPPADLLVNTDIALTLLAQTVTHRGTQFHDVAATLSKTGEAVDITQLTLRTADGLTVALRGNLPGGAQPRSGSFDVSGQGKAVVSALTPYGLPEAVAVRLARFGSINVSGVASAGTAGSAAVSLTVDGTLDDARVSGRVVFDGGWSDWRRQPLDGRLTVDAADGDTLLAALGNRAPTAAAGGDDIGVPGRLTVDLAGVARDRLFANVGLTGPGLALALAGSLSLAADDRVAAEGTANVDTRSARQLLALAGIDGPEALADVAAKGPAKLTYGADGFAGDFNKIAIGSATVSGKLAWNPGSNGKPGVIGGDLNVDRLHLQSLLDGILVSGADKPAPLPPAAAEAAAQTAAAAPGLQPPTSLWPDRAFDLAGLANIEGTVRLRAGTFDLVPGLPVADAGFDFAFADGAVRVKKLSGAAAGGLLEAEAVIARAPGGAEVWIKGKVADAEAARLVPAANGTGSLVIELAGRAQSPAGFIAIAEGAGELTFVDLSLPGPAPDLVHNLANSVISGTTSTDPKAMTAFVEASTAAGIATFGKGTAAVKVKDGAMRVASLIAKSPNGEAALLPTLDLASLTLDAAWQLSPPAVAGSAGPTGKNGGPLPGTSIVYIAKLQDIATRQVVIDVAELQRELSVRKLETSVDELERLRKIDEERARVERERRIAIEAERVRQEQLRAEAVEAERRAAEEALKAETDPTASSSVPAGFPSANGVAPNASGPPILPESAGTGDAANLTPDVPQAGAPASSAIAPGSLADPNNAAATPALTKPVRTYQGTRPSNQRQSRQRFSPGDEILRQLGGSVN